MKIIKRNGAEESFDTLKIVNAVQKACNATENAYLAPEQLTDIADYVEYKCNKLGRAVSVEEIQDMVENQLMAIGAFAIAKNYVRYRYDRSLVRKANTTDNRILSLIECNNEEVMQENSNKNPTVNSVQRDYMAGEVSKDLTRRLLLPEDIVEADKQGIIHFHDSDYFAQHMHNCDLVNLHHRDPDHRAGCQQPVWRTVLQPCASRSVRSGIESEDPSGSDRRDEGSWNCCDRGSDR